MKKINLSRNHFLIISVVSIILSVFNFFLIAGAQSDIRVLFHLLLVFIFGVCGIVFFALFFINLLKDKIHTKKERSKNIKMKFSEQKPIENSSNYFVNLNEIEGSTSNISNYINNINDKPNESIQESPCDKSISEKSKDTQSTVDNKYDSKAVEQKGCSDISSNKNINNEPNKITQETSCDEPILEKSNKETQRKLIEKFNVGPTLYKLQYSYDRIPIVGSKYIEGIEDIIKNLNSNSLIILKNETDNEYDKNAVGVYIMQNGSEIRIGYLKKDSHCYTMFNDYMNRGGQVLAVIDVSGDLLLKIGFYLPAEIESMKSIVFKPTSTNSNEAQENLDMCEVGDECDIEYDYDKDKNILYCNYGKIGTIPKKIDEIIESSSEYYLYIDSLETVEKDFEDIINPKIILYYE